jgi:hypothetical protein
MTWIGTDGIGSDSDSDQGNTKVLMVLIHILLIS